MSNLSVFAALRNKLAEIYATVSDARRLADDIGLYAPYIEFSGKAVECWHSLLREAYLSEKLDDLLSIALQEYPNNIELQEVCVNFRTFVANGGKPLDHPEPPTPGEPPFQGLIYFDVDDADRFFGREQLTAKLVAHLREHNFLAVIGASGSGKSSLVRAGVVAALKRGELLADGVMPPLGSKQWSYQVITPTAQPLEALARALTTNEVAARHLYEQLCNDSNALLTHCTGLLADDTGRLEPDRRLLLVIDQFEELFTLTRKDADAERQTFIDNLIQAAGVENTLAKTSPVTVIICLRADFYAACAPYNKLLSALNKYQYYIGAMNRKELHKAIEKPAVNNGWAFDRGLIDLMLDDVGQEPGALPLLSHVLLKTWEEREKRVLTLSGYQRAGRVQRAIATTAETVYKEKLQTEADRELVRHIFLRLIDLNEGEIATRRSVMLRDLIPAAQSGVSVEHVLKLLVDERLITATEDQIDVAHEALIRGWPRLQEWLQTEGDGFHVHRRLSEAVADWLKQKENPSYLYHGDRLKQLNEWINTNPGRLNESEQKFVKASQDALSKRNQLIVVAAVAALFLLIMVIVISRNLWFSRLISPPLPVDWVEISAGKFMMGSTQAQIDFAQGLVQLQDVQPITGTGESTGTFGVISSFYVLKNETPQHEVFLDTYLISRYEVTNEEYRRCVDTRICSPPDNTLYQDTQFSKLPVTGINWAKAKHYCQVWLYGDLPTEAQWEKAASDSSLEGSQYPWGNNPDPTKANVDNASAGPKPVGSYLQGVSKYGIADLSGNVWEWTLDWYSPDFYTDHPVSNPTGPETGDRRVIRGGSFENDWVNARSTFRRYDTLDLSADDLGFRCVCQSTQCR